MTVRCCEEGVPMPDATLLDELCSWASRLELADVPDPVIALAQSQMLSQLAAARAGMVHPIGARVRRAFGSPLDVQPGRAACALAGLTPWLYLDDTAYAGHLSNSTVNVPLVYAVARRLDGSQLLRAVIAANECAARITAAATLSRFRGQHAPHTHLAGAIAGRLRIEQAPAQVWVDALGLALSAPPYPSLHGFVHSDARVLSALSPVRLGLDACDAALAGLRGVPDVLEHEDGFLARFATVPLPAAVTAGLGTLWHTETLSFELQPGGPVHDTTLDCARELHAGLGSIDPDDVAEITVWTSLYSVLVHRLGARYLTGAESSVGALMFAANYLVATVLLTGGITVADFAEPAVGDPRRWALAAKVRVVEDEAMTSTALRCEVPFGEALRMAGDRAAEWLTKFGGARLIDLVGPLPTPSKSFDQAEKTRPARVCIRFTDGREASREAISAVGSAGPDTRARHQQLVRDKFLATGGPESVADLAGNLRHASAAQVAAFYRAALGTPDLGTDDEDRS